jgi:hypothetical protein
MDTAIWQGTNEEFARLDRAIEHNCECVSGGRGPAPLICAAHLMLEYQATLDHLLYVYRTRQLFMTRELYAMPGRRRSVRLFTETQ